MFDPKNCHVTFVPEDAAGVELLKFGFVINELFTVTGVPPGPVPPPADPTVHVKLSYLTPCPNADSGKRQSARISSLRKGLFLPQMRITRQPCSNDRLFIQHRLAVNANRSFRVNRSLTNRAL